MTKRVKVPVDLTAIMENNRILKVERYLVGRFSVLLDDGSFGVGLTVGDALAKAQAGSAANVFKVAA